MSTFTSQSGEENLYNKRMRIVLVGKTGVGKSASGNIILGRKAFESKLSSSSVTSDCDKATGEADGTPVAVVDTPGLFDTNLSQEEVIKKIAMCVSLSSPGPHVFLVVLQLGRFTKEERDTVEIIQTTFGAEAAKYTMVLFTNGDRLKGSKIEDFLSGNTALADMVTKCRGGCHVFNNEDTENRTQVVELLKKIERMVAMNGGGCYTTEMYQAAERANEEEKKRILNMERAKHREEEKRKASEKERKELREKYEREAREKAERSNSFIRNAMAVAATAAVMAGATLGTAVGTVAGPAGMAVGAAVGAAVGSAVGTAVIVVSEKCSIQ